MRFVRPSLVVAVFTMTVTVGCSKGESTKADQPAPTAPPTDEAIPTTRAPAPIAVATTTAVIPTTPPDFAAMPEYKFDKASPEGYCREQWTKRGELDSHMFNYCVGQETKGYAEIVRALKKSGKQPWMASLFPNIWEKWSKRGVTQYSMVAYNLKNEADKFLDYQYEQKQPGFNGLKMSRCEDQWESNDSRWTMTMHCYKEL